MTSDISSKPHVDADKPGGRMQAATQFADLFMQSAEFQARPEASESVGNYADVDGTLQNGIILDLA